MVTSSKNKFEIRVDRDQIKSTHQFKLTVFVGDEWTGPTQYKGIEMVIEIQYVVKASKKSGSVVVSEVAASNSSIVSQG